MCFVVCTCILVCIININSLWQSFLWYMEELIVQALFHGKLMPGKIYGFICFIFLLKIFIQLFWSYSFASLNPARSSPLPHPQNFHVLSQNNNNKNMKNNDKCQNLKVKTGKQANIKKISKTNTQTITKKPKPKIPKQKVLQQTQTRWRLFCAG